MTNPTNTAPAPGTIIRDDATASDQTIGLTRTVVAATRHVLVIKIWYAYADEHPNSVHLSGCTVDVFGEDGILSRRLFEVHPLNWVTQVRARIPDLMSGTREEILAAFTDTVTELYHDACTLLTALKARSPHLPSVVTTLTTGAGRVAASYTELGAARRAAARINSALGFPAVAADVGVPLDPDHDRLAAVIESLRATELRGTDDGNDR